MTQFIGLGSYKRVGKDTFANMLIEECHKLSPSFPIRKASFAYKLKQICHELYGWAGLREPEFYETEEGAALREIPLGPIGLSPRDIWIAFGTDAVRDQVYRHTWQEYLLNQDFHGVVIITDVRFPDEFVAIRERGGHLIKLIREGCVPTNGPDLALQDCRDWDRVIANNEFMSLRLMAHAYALRLVNGLKLLKQERGLAEIDYRKEQLWLKSTLAS